MDRRHSASLGASSDITEETDETREKLQKMRVKFLHLAHKLGQTPHNVVVAQVLYRLGLAEQLCGSGGGRFGASCFDCASAMAEQLEAPGQESLDFSCTIMVLGKTGVGKSATINSMFDESKFYTDAFQLSTKEVQDVVGTVQGIKVRVIDTPGLLPMPSWSDQRRNEKILRSVKQFIKKTPPDIVLYLDRLDMPSRELDDMPLLRTITGNFGPSIWSNAIVVLTHAASAPPEGPDGISISYDMFVTQRSHVIQQAIRLAAGDAHLMNPVSLVENHSACRKNRAGHRALPNGQVWKAHLLLLFFGSKILAEANALLKLQESPRGKRFVSRTRAPPLSFLLSSILHSRPPLELPMPNHIHVPLDIPLPVSADSDDPTHRYYRYTGVDYRWSVCPVVDNNGWDHDVGHEGVYARGLFVVKDKIPICLRAEVSKDKKSTRFGGVEVATTVKHGEGKATSLGFDLESTSLGFLLHSIQNDIAYNLRSETRFSYWKNRALAGLYGTLLGDTLTGGLKIEDKLIVDKQGELVASANAIVGRGHVAYGANFEATFRGKDPLGRFLSTIGLGVRDWHGNHGVECNIQSQIPVGRTARPITLLIGRLGIFNWRGGQFSIRIEKL